MIDGAGAKAKKNSDKKKLKEAEDDPEKYNQIVEKIEQRKKNGDKFILYLFGIFIVYLIAFNWNYPFDNSSAHSGGWVPFDFYTSLWGSKVYH